MSKKKKKSLLDSRFYRIYFTVLGAALVLILVGTVWLMSYLRDYESAQPIYVARDVAALFENRDFDNLYRLDSSAQQISGGDRAFYVENMHAIADGKAVEWSEAFTGGEDQRRYNVTLDGDRFATFTLVPNGQTTRRGNRLWTLGSVQTYVAVEQTPEETEETPLVLAQCRITAPKGWLVAVEGVTLSFENAEITEKPIYEDGFLPQGVETPVMVTYDYGAPVENPQVSVTDDTGAPAVLTQGEGNVWSCDMRENSDFRGQFAEAALSLSQKIAKFTSKDGSKDAILKYCAKDSPAREKFNNLSNQYATPHSEIAFQNENVGEFYGMTDDCFTCRVTFDYLMKTRDGVKTDPTAYIFCVIRQDGGWKLYNLLMG